MSKQYEKFPGKGFLPVPGYEPPAGTQAAEEERKKEAETRRKKEENEERWKEMARQQRISQEEANKRRKEEFEAERRKEWLKKRPNKPEPKQKDKSSWGLVILIIIVAAAIGKKDKGSNDHQKQKDVKPSPSITRVVDKPKKIVNSSIREGKPFNNGIFLYQEKIETYWNDWWGRRVISSKSRANSDKVEITIYGEGKAVDFIGTLTINCSNGSYSWSGVKNFTDSISGNEAKSIVPKRVIDNAVKFFCRGR